MNLLQRVFSKTARLPHPPEVMVELDRATRGDGHDTREVAAIVARDPAVAAKVLRLANSSFYGRPGQIGSLERAIQMVGLSDFRTMVLVTCVVDAFSAVPGVDLKTYWSHSATAAYMTSAVSALDNPTDNSSFVAGLLHSMGSLLLRLTLPHEAAQVDARVSSPYDFVGRIFAERDLLGFDHAQVGGEMLTRWKLPANLCSAVEKYPGHLPGDGALAACVFSGSVAATGSLSGSSSDDICDAIGPQTLERLNIEPKWLDGELKRSAELADDLTAMFN